MRRTLSFTLAAAVSVAVVLSMSGVTVAEAATSAPSPQATATAPMAATPQSSSTPQATSTPQPTVAPQPAAGKDPSLATMNQAHNHAMGATIRQYDPGATTARPNVTASPSTTPPGLPGLDVSGWQTNINWSQVYANGGRFAYVKATESTDYTSSQFASQYSGSYAAGLTRGAYHFAVPNVSSGAAQANYFVDNGGGWSQDGRTLPPLLDIEYDPYTSTDGTNTCFGLSAGAMVSWISDFSTTVYKRTGRYPAIYSTTGWWTACTGNSGAFGTNPLFIARYPNSISDGPGTLPAGWGSYSMWQYADSGTFPGDQDVFNGSAATLQQFAITGMAMSQPVIGVGDLNGDGKPDVVARRPDGSLWFYAGLGASGSGAGYAAGVQIASGMGKYDDLIGAGDVNGDGKPDLLARRTDGTLILFPGTGIIDSTHTGLGSPITISAGWDMFTDVIAAGDVNGDHKPDLLGRKPDGTLWLYAGTGRVDLTSVGFQSGRQVGTSWNIFTQVVGVGDLNGDGWDDLVGVRPDGSLWYYRGGAAGYQTGTSLSMSGFSAGDLLIAGGDANGDGRPDLLTRTASGALDFFAGTLKTEPAFSSPQIVGSGWGSFTHVVGAGDINGDGTPDVVATGSDGTLWFYAGNGSSGGVNNSYRAGLKIGWGWQGFTKVLNGGDITGDGVPDLLAVRNDGSLWVYPGTGKVNTAAPAAYSSGIEVAPSGWGAFSQLLAGDYDGDGVPDILATSPDGTMSFFRGIRQNPSSTAWFASPVTVGSGWNAYSSLVSSGDSNGDGKADVVAERPDGSLMFFAGGGNMSSTNPGLSQATQIGWGWNIFTTVTGTGDTSGGRMGDLLGVRTDGALAYYPTTELAAVQNIPGYNGAVVSGSGWNIFG